MSEFRRFFMRGLAALAPTLLTIALLTWAYRFVDQNIGRHITGWVVAAYAWGGPPHGWLGVDEETALKYGDPINEWDPRTGRRLTVQYKAVTNALGQSSPDPKIRAAAQQAEREALWEIATRKWMFFDIIGFVIGILLIYFMGYFLASFMGRRTWLLIEGTFGRIPIIKAVYPNVKQVTDLLIAEKKLDFVGVVAVQYPRQGIWSLGLATGPGLHQLRARDGRDLVTVFVPSSPTPFTGYTITVAREDMVELPLTFDEAFRFIVSGGAVRPGQPVAAASPASDRPPMDGSLQS